MNNFGNNLSGNNKQEKQSEVTPKVEEVNKGRRGILRGMFGAAVAVGIGKLGYESLQEEKRLNELYSSLDGQEGNFQKVHEAAVLLKEEMRKNNIPSVRLSGEHKNNHIEILITFLTLHLNSDVGHDYALRDKLFTIGFYTPEILDNIIETSVKLASKKSKHTQH